MSLKKRILIVLAALSQEWHQHQCKCGRTQWVEGRDTWTDATECIPCETKAFEAWQRNYHQRITQVNRGAA